MKYIKMTETRKAEALEDFLKFLQSERTSQDQITYKIKMDEVNKDAVVKPHIFFSAKAYIKILYLVHNNSTEVAWHGTVIKDQNRYLIDDILIYPQIVTGATVSADEEKYALWNIELDDDVANNLRLQGHSHVKFSVTPSATDRTYYDTILNTLHENGWYIFMIFNKDNALFLELHDFAQNIIFENKDIAVDFLLDDDTSASAWLADTKEHVKAYTPPQTTNSYSKENIWAEYYKDRYVGYGDDDEAYDDTRFGLQHAPVEKKSKTKKEKAQEQHNIWRAGKHGYLDKNNKFHPYPGY